MPAPHCRNGSCRYVGVLAYKTISTLKPKIPRKIYVLFSTLILFPCKVNFLIKRLISPCAAAPAGHSQACWTFQDLHTGPTFQTLKMTSRKAKKSVLNKISQIDLGAPTFLEIKNRNWNGKDKEAVDMRKKIQKYTLLFPVWWPGGGTKQFGNFIWIDRY